MILKSYFQKKKNLLLFTTFFIISISFIIVVIAYKLQIKLKLDVEINNKPENRSLIIGKDKCDEYDCIEDNLDMNKVDSLYEYIFDFYGDNPQLGTSLFKEGILEMLPNIAEGISLDSDSQNSVIIPKYIKLKNEIIETSPYLNNNIRFIINHYGKLVEYNPKVIGIYNNKDTIDEKTIIYYSYKDLFLFRNDKIPSQFIVFLQNENSITSFIDYLNKNDYYYNYFDDSKLKELNSYKNLYRLISLYEILIVLIIIGVIIIFISMLINDQRYNIALKKAVGYTNNTIKRILIKELVYYFTSIYLFLTGFICMGISIFDKNIFLYITIKCILLYLFIIIQILIVNIITFKKIKKIQIIDLLKQ